jgi:hypothetical protein
MADYNDNLSDVRPDAGTNPNISPNQLPMRGEKRIIPAPVSPYDVNGEFTRSYFLSGQQPPFNGNIVETDDFNTTAALEPFVDYVLVRLYNRGLGGNGQPDGNPAVYRFLINPAQVQINRQTLDGQAMARGGWQIGVWGEDAFMVTLTGKTPGQYFALGTTDQYQPYTISYRNLEQLVAVFENNGYWFEGEQAGEGPLASNGVGFSGGGDFTRRIIKMHADVQLIVGNFIWQGMFDSLTVSQNADEPFLMSFNISFVAWKERFRSGSPYQDTIHNDVLRGHDYGAWKNTAIQVQQNTQGYSSATATAYTPDVPTTTSEINTLIPEPTPTPTAPAVASAQASNTLPQVDPTANDSVPMQNVLSPYSTTNSSFWNGTLV